MRLRGIIGDATSLFVGVYTVSLGVLEAPGNWGADIVVGEGQPFGIGPTGGGPIYGIFACTKDYLRLMPGRIVGQSKDSDGEIAYTLTPSTREHHIRRHRATPNICSNETMTALMGAMHMALLGPEGLQRLAMRTAAAAQETMETVLGIDGVELLFPSTPIFREFAIRLPISSEAALERMDRNGVTGGFDLSRWWGPMDNALLIGCDERTSMDDIRKLSESLEKAIKEGSH